jgi:hypothetical protein
MADHTDPKASQKHVAPQDETKVDVDKTSNPPGRPLLFQRLSLHDHLIHAKSDKVQTPPLEWSSGVSPMSSLTRSQNNDKPDDDTVSHSDTREEGEHLDGGSRKEDARRKG